MSFFCGPQGCVIVHTPIEEAHVHMAKELYALLHQKAPRHAPVTIDKRMYKDEPLKELKV